MGAILAFLGSAAVRIFAEKVIMWVAFKAFLIFLFVMIFPIVMNNLLYDVMEIIKNFASQQSGTNTFNGGMSFTGFMAWLIESFRIAECISVIVGALILRVALRMVPFVRLG